MSDEDLRDALRAELAAQVPPPSHDGLAAVVGQGLRRRRARQLGTALAVTALLAGTTAAAAALSGGAGALPPAGPPAPASSSRATPTTAPTSTPVEVDWPRPDLPPPQPTSIFIPVRTGNPGDDQALDLMQCAPVTDRAPAIAPAPAALLSRASAALDAVAGGKAVGALVGLQMVAGPSQENSDAGWVYSADITDSDGTGSLLLTVHTFAGKPLAAADEQAFDEGNCDPPKRHVLADGSVLQLYSYTAGAPFVSLTRTLRIYRPDGTLYELAVASWGSPDLAPDPARSEVRMRVGPGRTSLPLTEAQLAQIGLAVAG